MVDPVTGRQINASGAVKRRLGATEGTVERELHACMIELVSGVCAATGQVISEFAAMRAEVAATGAGVLGSGTHPTATEEDAEITDKERYEKIRYLLGDAVATPVAGLHVHIGMPDAKTAIRVFNQMRRELPLLQALAANSPFRHGRDTGLASSREVTMRGWPRSGVPGSMRDYGDFCQMARLLTRAAEVPDYTWFWWKLRPHPRLGTVEIRALDAQTALEDVAALVALTHALARAAAEGDEDGEFPGDLLEEGLFRAARFGVQADLPDVRGELHPVAVLLEQALERVEPFASELGCAEELATVPALLERGGGAARQRGIHEISGIDSLLRELSRCTSSPDRRTDRR